VAGATNAGLLAAAIVGNMDPSVRSALEDFRRERTEAVLSRPDPSKV
jgi:5-(carboxyamino)imidazole ribonucleotide mutase